VKGKEVGGRYHMRLYKLKPDYRASTAKHLFCLSHLARPIEYVFSGSENIIYQ